MVPQIAFNALPGLNTRWERSHPVLSSMYSGMPIAFIIAIPRAEPALMLSISSESSSKANRFPKSALGSSLIAVLPFFSAKTASDQSILCDFAIVRDGYFID
jgi:hypothetical protein